MKKTVLAGLLGAVFCGSLQADTLLGIYVGADGWRTSVNGGFAESNLLQEFDFKDKTQTSYYAALEHPIPFMPNIRLQHNKLTAQGNALLTDDFSFSGTIFGSGTLVNTQTEFSNTDYILYYEILDNSLLSLDIGINGKYLSGSVTTTDEADGVAATTSISHWIPLLYSSAVIGLPLTGLELFAQGHYSSFDDSRWSDFQAGVAYKLLDNVAVDMRIRLGYKIVNLRLDDVDTVYTDIDFKGVFAGIELHF